MEGELKDLESEMLKALTMAEGNPVDNKMLIDTLTKAKEQAGEVQRRVTAAKNTELKIDEARQNYKPLSRDIRVLFFTLNQISQLDVAYRYSVEWFFELLSNCLKTVSKKGIFNN